MGSIAQRSALILCGDYMEDFEVAVPFYALQAFGVRVDCVSPNKKSGDKCITAVHEFLGFELYTELPGHKFELNANFEEVKPESYDALIIPGGRFTELLSVDEKCLTVVTKFAETGRTILCTCHSQLMLAAAGVLKGKKCTGFGSMKPVIELAGGTWWEQSGISSVLDITACLEDGNILSSIGWPAHGECLNLLFHSIGAQISSPTDTTISVLFLCGDYVEDYEFNVPFRALQGLGCRVDAVAPKKKRGETCVSSIYVDEGGEIPIEKRGHNVYLTADWDEIKVDDYDCVVVPGGRSPELLIMNSEAISMVKKFGEKEKIIAGFGQGQWLLAAASLLQGKRCASSHGMKVTVELGGGKVAETEGCVRDGKLLTAAGYRQLPAFVFHLANLLAFSVVF
ncbi:DJ-1 protein homolog E-like [Carica papaya]|uniref:DJ-1 protein homolog E-like n=1 Tax=Carica papaya TaxID=3649 RepID=UPI000B8CA335|nr:DJ-1 protein homolog E-like [Carica papaya]